MTASGIRQVLRDVLGTERTGGHPHSASVMRNSGLGIPASSAAFPAEIFPSSNSFTAAVTNNAGASASGATLRARSRSSGIYTMIALIVRPFLT